MRKKFSMKALILRLRETKTVTQKRYRWKIDDYIIFGHRVRIRKNPIVCYGYKGKERFFLFFIGYFRREFPTKELKHKQRTKTKDRLREKERGQKAKEDKSRPLSARVISESLATLSERQTKATTEHNRPFSTFFFLKQLVGRCLPRQLLQINGRNISRRFSWLNGGHHFLATSASHGLRCP